MTAKELAEMLSGRKYGMEITRGEAQRAADAGLVVVYGASDDLMEFDGAIRYEADAYNTGRVYFKNREPVEILPSDFCSYSEYEVQEKSMAGEPYIKAVWHNEGAPCWTFETDIPHETFTIMEDGEPWCIGIVFNVEHLGSGTHK